VFAHQQKWRNAWLGAPPRNQAIVNAENTIFSIKRFMGRKYDDPEVHAHHQPASRIKWRQAAQRRRARVIMDGKEYSPPKFRR
jgi:molecular chaperone DnaK